MKKLSVLLMMSMLSCGLLFAGCGDKENEETTTGVETNVDVDDEDDEDDEDDVDVEEEDAEDEEEESSVDDILMTLLCRHRQTEEIMARHMS